MQRLSHPKSEQRQLPVCCRTENVVLYQTIISLVPQSQKSAKIIMIKRIKQILPGWSVSRRFLSVRERCFSEVVLLLMSILCLFTAGCSGGVKASPVDIDLTKMGKTMALAEMFRVLADPEEYDGKSIRLTGEFLPNQNPETGETFYTCIIQDNTACCTELIEFDELAGQESDDSLPVPEEGDEVTIQGVFKLVEDDVDGWYCKIVDAKLLKVKKAD